MSPAVDAPSLPMQRESELGLLQYLEQEAELAEAECRADASRQSAGINAAAVQAADAHWRASVAAREREHAQARASAAMNAHQRSLQAVLMARDDIVTRVLDAAVARCNGLAAHPDMAGLLRDDVTRAREYLPDGPMVVRCLPALADMTRDALAGIDAHEATVTIDQDAPMGLVVQSGDGRIEVNLTLARRIASERAALAIRIVNSLQAPLP